MKVLQAGNTVVCFHCLPCYRYQEVGMARDDLVALILPELLQSWPLQPSLYGT